MASSGFKECIVKGKMDISDIQKIRNNIPALRDRFYRYKRKYGFTTYC